MRVDMERVRQAFGASQPAMDRRAPEEHHAVVAAILRQAPGGGAEVLLIRRSEHERDPWSGHMALPGGHRDPGDLDLCYTAMREILEEIGIDLVRDATLIGRLPGIRAVAQGRHLDFTIFPLVFALERDVTLLLNPLEVKEVVWAGLDHLLSPAAQSSVTHRVFDSAVFDSGVVDSRVVGGGAFDREVPRTERSFPAFDVQGHRVWGLTYRILQTLLAVVGTPSERDALPAGPGDGP
jgi:8-oxo-dGTP pyrophosphatase MutT (NUDIX family)